jgi:hypothetical protein
MIIVAGPLAKNSVEMSFAERDEVVEAFAADRSDQSFTVRVCSRPPGREISEREVPNG